MGYDKTAHDTLWAAFNKPTPDHLVMVNASDGRRGFIRFEAGSCPICGLGVGDHKVIWFDNLEPHPTNQEYCIGCCTPEGFEEFVKDIIHRGGRDV